MSNLNRKCAEILMLGLILAISLMAGCNSGSNEAHIFHSLVGFYPTPEIKDLNIVSMQGGEREFCNLSFSTDKDTFNKVLGKCFYEVKKDEISEITQLSPEPYLDELIANKNTHYFVRPDSDLSETGCYEDMSHALIARDEVSGKTYYHWHVYHY